MRERGLKTIYSAGGGKGSAFLIACTGYWELNTLTVHPAFRLMGVGNQLMRQICADADLIDVELRLDVAGSHDAMDDNQLRRWYERFGFTAAGPTSGMRRPRKSER